MSAGGLPIPILVVDDDAGKRLALKAALSPLGYTVVEAGSGLEALRCVMTQDFAVILLDVCMPVMDGFETAARIRERPRSEMTPIIFITAYHSDEMSDSDRYSEGAVDFIFAPVPPNELRAKVSVFANLFSRADELATQARDVEASVDQLRLLTDAAPIGIFQTDTQNRYVYTNPRWTEITGIPSAEAAGSEWEAIVRSEERAGLISELPEGAVDQGNVSQRFRIRVPDSDPRIVQVISKAILDRRGAEAGWVGTLADVTAEVGAEAAMASARDEATEASRQKSDFLANMSHEIRTPMNGVLGMTDLLLETDLDTRQLDYAQTVRNSGEALLTIIDDILDFSKVEAGKLEVEQIEFDLRGVVEDVVDLLAGPAQSKGLEVVAVVDSAVPALVGGDPGRVRQVLTNLLGNAVKFTECGEVVVRVTQAEVRGEETIVRFDVSDTGDGIAPDKLAMVFQPFVQADSSTSRKYGGTGLGLAISGQLVSLMGGECGVSSHLGEGSEFWFTIRVHAEAGQPPHERPSPEGLGGVSALVVDDNATQRGVLAEYLAGWGMSVEAAGSAKDAVEALQRAAADGRPFTLTLLDCSMPGMTDLELTRAIALDPGLSPRLVLMTGSGQEGDPADAAVAGVIGSLAKPIHRDDLRVCLQAAVGLQGEGAASRDVVTQRPRRSGGSPSGRLLLAEDNLINQKVAVAMLSGAGYHVDTVLNGSAAVEAVAAQRYDAILMDCHMPELNGYEATAAIRAQEGSDRHTPIIAVTAGARHEDRELCLASGMDSYLSKPVTKDALLALVARSIRAAH